MPPIYSGSEEWCYYSRSETTGSVKILEIIVDNFESKMEKASKLEYPQVNLEDTFWHIIVNPDSKVEGLKGHVGVGINNDNKEDLRVKFKIEIGNIVGEKGDGKVMSQVCTGWSKFMTIQECRDVLIDGKLKIKVEIMLLKEEVTNGSVDLKIFEDKSFTDFRVMCNGKSFPCHKVFLMARSSVFKTMIEVNMKEANEGSVEIEDYTETVAENFVKFFYTGHVDEEILKDNAVSFLDLGEKYDVAGLKTIAEQTMIANLDKENMLSLFQAGNLYRGKKIKAAAMIFIRQNRRSLVEQEGWKDAREDGALVLELLEFFSME